LQSLRIGLPKLMVSTLASGDVSRYVDVADITMMPSVTDLAGLDNISRTVLRTPDRGLERIACHINDHEFANALVQSFLEVAERNDGLTARSSRASRTKQ
jgi:uncharacterized protein (UPF0261 family)